MKTTHVTCKKQWVKRTMPVLKKRRKELLENRTQSQIDAYERVYKIAEKCFKFHVDQEKILQPYIIDIYINVIRVGIEIDGSVHSDTNGYDDRRDIFLLKNYGTQICRFKNKEVNSEYFDKSIWDLCFIGLFSHLQKIKDEAKKNNIKFMYKDFLKCVSYKTWDKLQKDNNTPNKKQIYSLSYAYKPREKQPHKCLLCHGTGKQPNYFDVEEYYLD